MDVKFDEKNLKGLFKKSYENKKQELEELLKQRMFEDSNIIDEELLIDFLIDVLENNKKTLYDFNELRKILSKYLAEED